MLASFSHHATRHVIDSQLSVRHARHACKAVGAAMSIHAACNAAESAACVYACNVYVSEGQNDTLIQQLQTVARSQPGVTLAWTFVDRPYHRTGFTLTSRDLHKLGQAVVALGSEVLQRLDLRQHTATHPRLGVLDHVSMHPLLPRNPTQPHPPPAHTSSQQQSVVHGPPAQRQGLEQPGMAPAVEEARAIAAHLGGLGLPVYLYGHAHPEHRRLADIRRQLGYFKSTGTPTPTPAPMHSPQTGVWSGPTPPPTTIAQASTPVPPDFGPDTPPAHWGVLTLGVRPWVANYNVPVMLGTDSSPSSDAAKAAQAPGADDLLAQGKVVARLVSERGGGLRSVEAMALLHEGGRVEVACNLLDADCVTPEAVQARVQELATQHGLSAGSGYLTNLTPQQLIDLTPNEGPATA